LASTAARPSPSSRNSAVPARVSARIRIAAAIVVAVATFVGMIVLVIRIRSDDRGIGHVSFASTQPAVAPFGQFSETRVSVGSRCLRVLVASSPSQRVQGLREVRSLAPYDGMLFVFAGDSTASFTMAGTPTPLDITFFSGRRIPVDHKQMKPCVDGTDATCPEYDAKERYRYALEQPAGSPSASGTLGACSG
jgi:uncharacterized membrane protein (UPF0127 family)